MTEHCPDVPEMAHRRDLPGEQKVQCEQCGKMIYMTEANEVWDEIVADYIYICNKCKAELDED